MSVLQNIKCSKHLNLVRRLHVYRNIIFIYLDDAERFTQCQVNQREMSAIPIRAISLMILTRPVMYKLSM
jgi:hypothetical protein